MFTLYRLMNRIYRLLNVDSDRRMTVEELLNSAWLNDVEPIDNIDLHDSGIMRNPVSYIAPKPLLYTWQHTMILDTCLDVNCYNIQYST